MSNDRNDLQELPEDDPQESPGVQKVIVLVGPLKPLRQWLEERKKIERESFGRGDAAG